MLSLPERKPRRTVNQIVLDGDVFVTSGKRREVNPELQRLFQGKDGMLRARTFLHACQGDADLRRAAEDQGMDLDGWKQQLDDADLEAQLKGGRS